MKAKRKEPTSNDLASLLLERPSNMSWPKYVGYRLLYREFEGGTVPWIPKVMRVARPLVKRISSLRDWI